MFNSCLPIIVTVSTGFQNVIKADEITFDVGIRIGNAVSDACLCCQVYYYFGLVVGKDFVDECFVS